MTELVLVIVACLLGVTGAMTLIVASQSRVLAERRPKWRGRRPDETGG